MTTDTTTDTTPDLNPESTAPRDVWARFRAMMADQTIDLPLRTTYAVHGDAMQSYIVLDRGEGKTQLPVFAAHPDFVDEEITEHLCRLMQLPPKDPPSALTLPFLATGEGVLPGDDIVLSDGSRREVVSVCKIEGAFSPVLFADGTWLPASMVEGSIVEVVRSTELPPYRPSKQP